MSISNVLNTWDKINEQLENDEVLFYPIKINGFNENPDKSFIIDILFSYDDYKDQEHSILSDK